MDTFSFKEDQISQIPALELLQKLGYTYLNPEQALELRGGKTTNVLLEDVLRKQLKEINSIKVSSTKTAIFSDANIENGILALKDTPMQEGYIAACQVVYERLTFGKALEQSIDGDKKSFTVKQKNATTFAYISLISALLIIPIAFIAPFLLLLLPISAIVFGALGLKSAKRKMALAGLIIGIITLVLLLIGAAIVASSFNGVNLLGGL